MDNQYYLYKSCSTLHCSTLDIFLKERSFCMLKVRNIKKNFKGNEVLKGVNLEVNECELVHIKGINGSGKSTLLKIIAGLMQQDEGEVTFENDVYLGALIENPNFIESETAVYNLKFLYDLKNTYDEANVKLLFEKLQLDYALYTPIKKYSVGMRQKVGIIQAVMENQNLILFDEPTRGLDEESIYAFNDIISSLIKQKKSVIICAHDGVSDIAFTHRYELKNGLLQAL